MKKTGRKSWTQGRIASVVSALSSADIQSALMDRARTAVLSLVVGLLEADVVTLCGAPYARKGEGLCRRGGSDRTSVIVGGARYGVTRPRVRDAAGEVELPALKKLQEQELLDEEMRQRLLIGVSTRNYEQAVEGYAEKLGVSKSSVSRAFIRASQKDLDSINHASLAGQEFVALAIDGIEIAGRSVVAVLGVRSDLSKVLLGLLEGETESADVVRELLASLQERGFELACERLLALIDGSKALRKGLRAVFGERLVIQRCWLHKTRNIRQYLPEQYHGALLWRMKRLMNLRKLEDARKDLKSLRAWLEGISVSAAESLDEAGDELLAVHQMGINGELRKSLSSTNMIESLFSVVRTKISRVKNWRSRPTNQIMRWVASSALAHKKKMRRLRGLSQASALMEALGVKVAKAAA